MTIFAPTNSNACGCESCPSDLCCFAECHCSPPAASATGRRAARWLGRAASATAMLAAGRWMPRRPRRPF